ncbi:multi-copper oxidase [Mycena rosella]|uniref:Multi-copper oxidase n=1 Tax=Mycena rosella TaxID=1033263 RepID=A0AAD7BP17_MYCRO|nr:multi-copper oxidase [Mycena rosella]
MPTDLDASWHDADEDENTLLMKTFDGEGRPSSPDEELRLPPPRSRQPNVRRRRKTLITACLVVIPILLIVLWIASQYTKAPHPVPEFSLDPEFLVESTSRTRVYHWTVSEITGTPVGLNKTMFVVNGKSPGPLIEANHNDRIIVHVTNGLPKEGTSIHWHGLYQNHTDFYDGTTGVTQCAIPPGETLVYNFTLDGWSGTTWWHGHTDMQHTEGLFGPIVVHQPKESVPPYDEEHVIILSDIYNAPAADLLTEYLNSNPMETVPEPVPDSSTINGQGQFVDCDAWPHHTCTGGSFYNLSLTPNKTYRLRLINTGSFAAIRFSVDGHNLTVISADGTPVEPVTVDRVMVQVAQRYDVLLTTDQPVAVYWMRSTLDQSMFMEDKPLRAETLAILHYTNASDPAPVGIPHLGDVDLEPESLVPADAVPAPRGDVLAIPFKFSIQRTHFQNWRSFINGTSWELLPQGQATRVAGTASAAAVGTKVWPGDQLIASIDNVRTVDLILDNLDDADHPFHLHGYTPWIMGTGKGRYKAATAHLNTTNPMRRDTFFVRAREWIVVRIVTDNPGYWAFHCHVAWHMAAGGLFQVAVQPARVAEVPLPADIVAHCAGWRE